MIRLFANLGDAYVSKPRASGDDPPVNKEISIQVK